MTQPVRHPGLDSTATLIVTAPYDGEKIAELSCTDQTQLNQWLEAAARLHSDRSAWLPLAERIGILERAARIMLREKTRLAFVATQEGGKPLLDVQLEVERAIDGVKIAIEVLRSEAGIVIPIDAAAASRRRAAFSRREPGGVVVAISAFNLPLNVLVNQVVSAVAAGCPVIMKPARETPLFSMRLVGILREAGLSESWCRVLITRNVEVIESLVTDKRIAFLSFIGNARAGWSLRAKLAPGVRFSLELGGTIPVIVADDANWDLAVRTVTKGAFYHAGQAYRSFQRIFVPRDRAREFADLLSARAAKLRLGDPRSAATDIGPLICPSEATRVGDWVDAAIAGGVNLIGGGRRSGRGGYVPTTLLDPAADAQVSQNEIPGPVVCVHSYACIDSAIAMANAVPFSIQASVFTGNLNRAMNAFRKLDAPAVTLNDDETLQIDGMPYAGLRESGPGRGGVRYTITAMSIEKMLVIHSTEP